MHIVNKAAVASIKGQGTDAKARHLLHSLAHVEASAVDLYADTLARFAEPEHMPEEMLRDLATIVADEARHFGWLDERLRARYGCRYGQLQAHSGLKGLATDTRHDLGARLVVVPLVQEARALDSQPRLVRKLEAWGDGDSAGVVRRICEEEVPHVAAGVRWFRWLCRRRAQEPGV